MIGRRFLAGRGTLAALRETLAGEREVFEPRASEGGSAWRLADRREPLDEQLAAPLSGVKSFFFPERETLLRFAGEQAEPAVPAPAPFALVGLRACDLAAIGVLDRFFATDAAYLARRSRALLVGVNCLSACVGGFCLDVQAGPFATGVFDLSLTRLRTGRFAVEVGSEAGQAALEAAADPLLPLDDPARRDLELARTTAVASFPSRPFVRRALERMAAAPRAAAVADAEWEALGPACFACTGCTSLCPTCSCFTVVDEVAPVEAGAPAGPTGERVRLWDSCLLEGFQREGSGHHPAPRAADRVRRFWSHKLSPDFVPQLGRLGCVGCGRCDVTCPGSIGAIRVLRALGGGDA